MKTQTALNRREFLGTTSASIAAASLSAQFPSITTHAAPDDPIRVGVIGCGGRGTGAVLNVLQASTRVVYPDKGYHTEDVADNALAQAKNIHIVALADLFPDRLQACRQQLKQLGIEIPDAFCFTGFDAYLELLKIPEINYVILATPPHFRPDHLKAAIDSGKHVFMEKPAAVDGPGVRKVIEAGELAKQKGLGIVAGTQRRHSQGYLETIQRIQDGALGQIHTCKAYWNGGVIWVIERQPGWSDMEWQLRNWNYFTWLGGDHMVEQHVHNIDVMNWVLGEHPIRAWALGGRQARQGDIHGHIYDHFAVEYEYPNGVSVFTQCRQMNGCTGRVEETVVGTHGSSQIGKWIRAESGNWRFRGPEPNPYEQEHLDLINSIRAGKPLNEARALAESTLTAIMGRESAYSGHPVEWDQALNSHKRWGPTAYRMGPTPFPEVPIPGSYTFS